MSITHTHIHIPMKKTKTTCHHDPSLKKLVRRIDEDAKGSKNTKRTEIREWVCVGLGCVQKQQLIISS